MACESSNKGNSPAMKRISLTPKKTTLEKYPWRVNLPASITQDGKRERRFFATKIEATTFCEQQSTRLDNFGRNSTTLSPGQLEQAALAFARLPEGVALNTVVAEWLALHDTTARSVTFKEMFERFMESKAGHSAAYQTGLKYTLPRFEKLHERIVATIKGDDLDRAMKGMTATVRNSFMRNLRAAFNFGIKREWLTTNPVEKIEFAAVKQKEVVTLTPSEAAALMLASENHPDLIPYHALALFAGIRPMELERLEWRHVDMIEGHVEIVPEVSKTGRRRIIDMEPSLRAWLERFVALGGSTEGKIVDSANLRTRLRAVRAAAGLEKWHQDVMRHSYASFWLAEHGDINKLTIFMGHESTAMLWKHYHRASKKKAAAAFWKIEPAPAQAGKIVVMGKAA